MADFIGSYPPPNNTKTPTDDWALTPEGSFAYLDKQPMRPGDWYDPAGITVEKYNQRQALKLLQLQTKADLKEARRAEMLDKIQNDQNARLIAEGAFGTMIASCVNNGQYQLLMTIKDDWIKDAALGEVQSFTTYMSKWRARLGA